MSNDIFLVRPARLDNGIVPTRTKMNINDPDGAVFFEEIFHTEKSGREVAARYSGSTPILYRAKIVDIAEVTPDGEIFLVRPARLADGVVPVREVLHAGDPNGPVPFEDIFHDEKSARKRLVGVSDQEGMQVYQAKIVDITEVDSPREG